MSFRDIFLLPNLITLIRFFSAIYLFIYFIPEEFNSFILIFIIAIIGLSDSLDGIVARKFNLVSKLGIILDPLTDRIVFIILLFWLSSIIPQYFLYAVLIREVLVLLGSIYVLLTGASINVSQKGKFATVFLFVLICLYVLNSTISIPFLDQFSIVVIIFYFYVAFEYLYNLIYKSDNETIPLDSSSSSAEEPLYILSLLNNELMSSSWKLINKNYNIGRSSENNIILDDITVSRNHALLSVSKDNINIVDNNSTNGIYINNEITNSCKIKSGDKIQIGKYLLLLTEVTK